MASNPFAVNTDGSAKDPAAYGAALRADPERIKALQVRLFPEAKRGLGRQAASRARCAAARHATAQGRVMWRHACVAAWTRGIGAVCGAQRGCALTRRCRVAPALRAQSDPELSAALLGDDMTLFQHTLRKARTSRGVPTRRARPRARPPSAPPRVASARAVTRLPHRRRCTRRRSARRTWTWRS